VTLDEKGWQRGSVELANRVGNHQDQGIRAIRPRLTVEERAIVTAELRWSANRSIFPCL